MSPFPWLPMLALSTGLVSHSYALTSLFPYVGYMVQHIGLTENKDEAGFYAGYLASAFMVGRFSSSYFWGRFSDRRGRLPVIHISLLVIAAASIGFGLSTNFYWAVTCRFVLGLMNGLVAVAKTMISEVCKREHEVKGMSFITGSWAIGFIIGPGLGGILAEPAKHYPHYFSQTGLFGRFPYLLPNVVGATLALVALPMVSLFLHETNPAGGSLRDAMNDQKGDGFEPVLTSDTAIDHEANVLAEEGRAIHNPPKIEVVSLRLQPNAIIAIARDGPRYGSTEAVAAPAAAAPPMAVSNNGQQCHPTMTSNMIHLGTTMIDEEPPDNNSTGEPSGAERLSPAQSTAGLSMSAKAKAKVERNGSGRVVEAAEFDNCCQRRFCMPGGLLAQSRIRDLLAVYSIQSFVSIGFQESFPLWALSTVARGGLDWTTKDIGQVLSMCGPPMMISQFVIYPELVKRLGINYTQRLGALGAIPMYILFPLLGNLHQHREALIVAMLTLMIIINGCNSAMFVSIALAINNAVEPKRRGEINGLSMTVGSLGKAIGPSAASVIFAWSINRRRPFPFGTPLVFLLMAVSMFVVAALGWTAVDIDNENKIPIQQAGHDQDEKKGMLSQSKGQKSHLPGSKSSERLLIRDRC